MSRLYKDMVRLYKDFDFPMCANFLYQFQLTFAEKMHQT